MKKRVKTVALLSHGAVLCMSALILSFSARSAAVSSGDSEGVLALLQSWGLTFLTEHIVRKAGHFTEFFILGVLLCIAYAYNRRAGGPKCLRPFYSLYGLLLPLTDETSQYLSPGRSPQISDVWLDFAGVLCGVAIMTLLLLVKRHRRRRRHGNG